MHEQTPLWESAPLSHVLGRSVFLKMEALQPIGSFKLRGIGHACRAYVEKGAKHLVCSSGGNAGYAVAYTGRRLQTPVTVVVPETTPGWMRNLIRSEGASVLEQGVVWDEAHEFAVGLAKPEDHAYIHPFDDPLIWDGHASIVDELFEVGWAPGAIVLAVGGGGLLCGVLQGLHRVGWADVPVVAVETEGAASLYRSIEAGRLVTLRRIQTIATTLGARRVAAEALNWTKRHWVTPWLVQDLSALDACIRFSEHHRVLVEPACGAALAAVYDRADPLEGLEPVVVIVCGGAGVTLELLQVWREQLGG